MSLWNKIRIYLYEDVVELHEKMATSEPDVATRQGSVKNV